jgi:signal transduction histidine kinase
VQVGATVLALAAGLALAGAGMFAAWRARARPVPRALALTADALGDAVLVVDRAGAVALAGGAAGRLAGIPARRLEGLPAERLLGDDVAVLLRDARRGPAAGDVRLPGSGAARAARVAAAPLGGGRVLLVLRPLAVARPPPLPVAAPPPVPARRAAAHAELAAASAALRGPARRASTAAALLRLQWPTGAAADGDLARLEEALGDLDRRLRALAVAGGDGAGRTGAVDVAAVAADVAAAPLPGGGRVRAALAPARATCEEGRLRTALRELLRAAAAAHRGAPLELAVRCSGARVLVEVTAGALPGEELAGLARALLGAEGGEVEVDAVPGRVAVCRVSLPRCAPERPPAPGPGGSFDAGRAGR